MKPFLWSPAPSRVPLGPRSCGCRSWTSRRRPHPIGTVVGRQFTSQAMSVIFLTLAAGSILYVVIQLLGVAHKKKRKDLLSWGVLLGLAAGFLTDMVVTAGGA